MRSNLRTFVLTVAVLGLSIAAAGHAMATTGTIVPLYSYPTASAWSSLIAAKNAHPTVPVVAVVNPSSGPGGAVDSTYTTGINNLRAANVIVVGYVYTNYAGRAAATVQSEVDKWRSFYPAVNGIFFDEMSNTPGNEGYYSALDMYARGRGFSYTVGNPGTDTTPSYVGTVNTIIVYESSGVAALPSWYTSYARGNFAVIPYNVPSLDTTYVNTAKQSVGWIYLTNDNLPNPWDTLSSYFSSLLDTLTP
jgi:Spherulation-specific family 4